MYNVDQWKIFKFLGAVLPKRDSVTIGAIKDKQFKQASNDRVVRNAIRKPVKEGHIEISDRGTYRFTVKGANFFTKMEKEGFKPTPVRAMAKPERKAPAKKVTPKAVPAKKVAKPAQKAAPKAVEPKAKPVKKVAPKAAAPKAKPVEAKGNGNTPKPKKSSVKIPRPKAEAAPTQEAAASEQPPAQLTF